MCVAFTGLRTAIHKACYTHTHKDTHTQDTPTATLVQVSQPVDLRPFLPSWYPETPLIVPSSLSSSSIYMYLPHSPISSASPHYRSLQRLRGRRRNVSPYPRPPPPKVRRRMVMVVILQR
eukprot:GHVQ01022896.1.p1 GENE.GHVQ01022896.1~~GHVQ01022896.1.p1  ORF type:complete len:120 (-),score=24.74 GHVQ01022896.1:52-411(-)